MKTKGLSVSVYKSPLGECTNKGISHDKIELILIGEGIPEIFEGDENNTVKSVKRKIGLNEYLHVEPVNNFKNDWVMFGGNFIYTSDSRFPSKYPIPIHDRIENY